MTSPDDEPQAPCAACRGTGMVPGRVIDCPACKGRGVVLPTDDEKDAEL